MRPFWPAPCLKTPPERDELLLAVAVFPAKIHLKLSSQLPPSPIPSPQGRLPWVLALLGKFLLERDLRCPPPSCLGWGEGNHCFSHAR